MKAEQRHTIGANRMNVNFTLKTNGKGICTKKKSSVKCVSLLLDFVVFDGNMVGSFFVEFDKSTWDISKDGLIYDDPGFIKDLRKQLRGIGFTLKETNNIDYSERGRQGKNYVDFDAGEIFIKKFIDLSESRVLVE